MHVSFKKKISTQYLLTLRLEVTLILGSWTINFSIYTSEAFVWNISAQSLLKSY